MNADHFNPHKTPLESSSQAAHLSQSSQIDVITMGGQYTKKRFFYRT